MCSSDLINLANTNKPLHDSLRLRSHSQFLPWLNEHFVVGDWSPIKFRQSSIFRNLKTFEPCQDKWVNPNCYSEQVTILHRLVYNFVTGKKRLNHTHNNYTAHWHIYGLRLNPRWAFKSPKSQSLFQPQYSMSAVLRAKPA